MSGAMTYSNKSVHDTSGPPALNKRTPDDPRLMYWSIHSLIRGRLMPMWRGFKISYALLTTRSRRLGGSSTLQLASLCEPRVRVLQHEHFLIGSMHGNATIVVFSYSMSLQTSTSIIRLAKRCILGHARYWLSLE